MRTTCCAFLLTLFSFFLTFPFKYFFKDGEETEICMAPHGNSKSGTTNYYRTQPTTLEALTVALDKQGAKKAGDTVFQEAGGSLHSRSMSEDPRNQQQARSLKHRYSAQKDDDELYSLIMQQKEHASRDDKGYIHGLKIEKAPQYVLANRRQLQDLVRFATNPIKFSVVGMDPTFRLGRFFVTPLVYQNLTLIKRRDGKHPYFFGPAFVHQTRLTEDYRYFISQLKIINPTLKLVQAMGTDDELALSNAVLSELPDAIRLKCKIHKRDNVKKKLQAMKISTACEGEILKDIFGEVTGGTLFRGLYHSKNPDALDQKLADLHEKWENLAPDFFRWFQKEEAGTFKTSMIESVRRAAQVEDDFTMNASESLKSWVDREKSTMTGFNEKFENLRAAQESEAEKAIYGCGEYELAENFNHLQVEPNKWKQMSPQSRQKHIAKFWSVEIEDAQNFEVLVGNILGEIPPETTYHEMEVSECSSSPPSSHGRCTTLCHDEYPSQENREAEMQDTLTISIPLSSFNLPSVPSVVLKAIWQKAAELISINEMIANCPGNPKARMVASRRGDKPHYVKELAGGKVTCDCYNYSSIQICAHSVAAAEHLGCLERFLQWRERCSTKIPNFTKLVLSDAPKGAGEKNGRSNAK